MSAVLDQLCVNTIRALSIDMIQKANSGHPGLPLGAAAMGFTIWDKHLRHNPADPQWINRDRFVLSAGHGCALHYSLLNLTGYDVTIDDLKQFRQWESITPGHPELFVTPGVEATTGPLGQGVGNIVGIAIAREQLAAMFNRENHEVIDFRVFGICSDGDLMEGVASEAASLAGHLGLGCITLLYDDNHISIDGRTDITFSEDVNKRFEAYGWHVLDADGLDVESVDKAILAGIAETTRPTLIRCRTTIGYGSPNKADTPGVHGSPLGEAELKLTKQALSVDPEKLFDVPSEVFKHMRLAKKRGAELQKAWGEKLELADEADESFGDLWERFWSLKPAADWRSNLPVWKEAGKSIATRKASQEVIHSLTRDIPWMIGGSADLACSNLTEIKDGGNFSKENRAGRNLRFGIREHGMGAILNGIAATAPFIAFGSTFLTFLDYVKPSVRIAALSGLPVIYVFTHDSIGLGEDGPTHQPIEQLWSMRATPNLYVFRPADANETAQCWQSAVERRNGPSVLALSRQGVPVIEQVIQLKSEVNRGAYILEDAANGKPDLILLATGSEVAIALEAKTELEGCGIATRVVSMPCLELFDEQPQDYRGAILPKSVKHRIAVEAGATTGWWKYVGLQGDVIGIDRFGASAPDKILFENYGITAGNIIERAKQLFEKNK
ncbi:transketolase [bacterium]|nr:transketolase [bacterium]